MPNRKTLSPADLDQNKIVYLSPGHAPGMVTTIGPAGNVNVATFEQVMIVSYRPPRVMIAISQKCDTYKNIQDGSDCVVGFPRAEYIQVAYDGGVKAPRDLSELDIIENISTYPSKIVTPLSIEQCWINMECKLKSVTPAGDHDMVLLDIVNVTLDEAVWRDDKVERRNNLPAVYYTTSGHFFTPGQRHHVSLSENLRPYDNAD
ncbi:MAG TPA: flavin reductase family protein [Candidatus Saccharimonadales bacterium]|nr:flavin reductase family protein [Candidatus Saccharimonadales bacterium]